MNKVCRTLAAGAMCISVLTASTAAHGFSDGHQLLEAATSGEELQSFGFVWYVKAVAETLLVLQQLEGSVSIGESRSSFCFPDTMTYHELADEIRLDLLKMNRSDMADVLDLKAPLLLISFFQLHFHCDQ